MITSSNIREYLNKYAEYQPNEFVETWYYKLKAFDELTPLELDSMWLICSGLKINLLIDRNAYFHIHKRVQNLEKQMKELINNNNQKNNNDTR